MERLNNVNRAHVYGVGLLLFLGSTAMTIASIIIPEWVTWDTKSSDGRAIHYTYGLHSRCSSITNECTPFPEWADCHGGDTTFCSLWRTSGFLMSLAVILEFATIVTFGVILLGGKQQREQGWKILTSCMAVAAAAQLVAMALVAHLNMVDERFFDGWKLDKGFWLCTVSWAVEVVVGGAVAAAAVLLPEEGGYELIPESPRRSSSIRG